MRSSFAAFWLTFLLGQQCLTSAAVHEDCSGSGGAVLVQAAFEGKRGDVWVGLGGPFGRTFPSKDVTAQQLVLAEPLDGCAVPAEHSERYTGKVALVERGSCTFVEKAQNLQQANVTSVIIYDNGSGCSGIAAGNVSEAALAAINVSIAIVSQDAGAELLAAASNGIPVFLWAPKVSRLDPSAGVIWLMAVCAVAAAALWAGHDFMEGRKKAPHSLNQQVQQSGGAVEVQMVTGAAAVAFVAGASAMLLLLFFFLNHVFVIVLVVLFSIAAFQAMAVAFTTVASAALPRLRGRAWEVPCLGRVSLPGLVALVPAAAWLGAWLALRKGPWGWVFQDGMGIALIILILRQFLIPNTKVACILLPLCFLYDIFFVFLQPMITHGPSVMVEVAQGGSSHESMPMLLQVPGWWGPPYGSTILGFGDVVLPGQLIVFARIVDLAWQLPLRSSYFLPLVCGYGAGLIMTFAALLLEIGGSQGQPALLYLVPCTLGLMLALAWWRGDLHVLWQGIDRVPDLENSQDRRDGGYEEREGLAERSSGDSPNEDHDIENMGTKW